MRQLGLFGGASIETAPSIRVTDEERETAASVPRFVRFGTSSWTFPGWPIWIGAPSLAAYASHPLMRAAGLDRSYYGPLVGHDAEQYAAELANASDFRFVSKVWEEVTTFVYPGHARYGAKAGTKNSRFLDAQTFVVEVLEPLGALASHLGPFVFELTPMPPNAISIEELTARIASFVEKLPVGPRYAFELRNQELLGPRWFDCLRAHRVAHVFTYWTAMPSIRMQLARGGMGSAKHAVARLMLPPFTRYAAKKAEFAPFDRLVEIQPDMRDDVIDLLRAAAAADVDDAYVIVNNKAEGSAPLTIRELAIRAARELR